MLGEPRSLVMGLHDKQEVMSRLWVDGGDVPGIQGAWVLTTPGSLGVVQVERTCEATSLHVVGVL